MANEQVKAMISREQQHEHLLSNHQYFTDLIHEVVLVIDAGTAIISRNSVSCMHLHGRMINNCDGPRLWHV